MRIPSFGDALICMSRTCSDGSTKKDPGTDGRGKPLRYIDARLCAYLLWSVPNKILEDYNVDPADVALWLAHDPVRPLRTQPPEDGS